MPAFIGAAALELAFLGVPAVERRLAISSERSPFQIEPVQPIVSRVAAAARSDANLT
jgi:hypothetical protein